MPASFFFTSSFLDCLVKARREFACIGAFDRDSHEFFLGIVQIGVFSFAEAHLPIALK